MKNTFARFGRTFLSALVAGGLMVGTLAAGTTPLLTVNLPHAVTVGNTTLPSGHYTISTVEMAGGDDIFLIRSDKGNMVATMQAQKVILGAESEKTQVVLTKDGDTWNIQKLFIEGDGIGYQFSR